MLPLKEIYDSPELINALAEECPCGSPRILSEGLHTVVCSNSTCFSSIAARLAAIAERYEMSDALPLSDLEFLCKTRGYRSWLDFFSDDELDDSGFEDEQEKLFEAVKSDLDVSQIAILSGFTTISEEQVHVLLDSFETVTDFADTLDRLGVLLITDELDLRAAHLLPIAVHIFNRLSSLLGDMLETEEIFGV